MWRNFYVYAFMILFFIQFILLATFINAEKDVSFSKRSQSHLPIREDTDYDHEPEHNDNQPEPNEYSKELIDEDKDVEEQDYDEYGDEDETDSESDPKHFGLPLREDNDGIDDTTDDERSDNEAHMLDLYKKMNRNGFGKVNSISTTAPTTTTIKTSTTPASDISMSCPKGCACLGDFMDCIRQHLSEVPSVPDWVHSLELSSNDLDETACEQNIRNLDNLIDLHLNHNKLSRFPLFVGLRSLQTLQISSNAITSISMMSLQAIPELTHLDLSRNSIKSIPPNVFVSGNLLQKINLNYNQIGNLHRMSFSSMIHLIDLKLNNNQISHLPTGIFANMKKLKKLSLNGNQLKDRIQYATFSNLTALTSLKLRNNSIKELITGVFHGLNNLNILDLGSNELTGIHKEGLLNITTLTKLVLSNNSIHTIEKNCWEFTQKINHLDLCLNRLTDITSGTFELLSKLKVLDLHSNQISKIAAGAFNATPNLQSLDLSQNEISWTIEDLFAPFASLNQLDAFYLNNNRIKSVNKNAFLGLTSLTRLDLRKNNITSIQPDTFDNRSTPALRQLLIDSNDLICDCNLSWFYKWLRNDTVRLKSITEFEKDNIMKCAYPTSLRGRKLLDLHIDNFTCYDTPKPRIIDEPKASVLAIIGTDLTLECTAVLTVGSNITFRWTHDDVDISPDLIETQLRTKETNNVRADKEKINEKRREVNRIPMKTNVGAPKVPLTSSSVSKLKNTDDDDDDEEDDEEHNKEEEDSSDEGDDNTEENLNGEPEDLEASIPINSTIATSRVRINNVSHNHDGRYQCIALNTFGTTYSQRFKVTAASFPRFTKTPSNVSVNSSKHARLDCAADGDPKPQVYWQFNFGNDFPAARERRMQVMPGDEAFFIKDTKLTDQGVYTCTAENPAGIIKANATVIVLEPPTLAKPLENKNVILGESSVLECMKSGSPSPSVRWYKDGLLLQPMDRYFFTADDQLLIIVKTIEADAGIYKCELQNSGGQISNDLRLNVRMELPPPNGNNENTNFINTDEMTAIVIITVVCCAVGTSIIWVVIIYQTRKESTCSGGSSNAGGIVCNNQIGYLFNKDHNPVATNMTNHPLYPPNDGTYIRQEPTTPMRTATISNGRVLRSNSGSSNGNCSIEPNDEIFRHYQEDCPNSKTPLQKHRIRSDSDDDDQNTDNDALLGTNYYGMNGIIGYPKNASTPTRSSKDKDSYIVQMQDGVESTNSQLDTGTTTTTTAECVDDDNQHSPTKTKASMSLSSSSSCHSIPPLPYNTTNDYSQSNGSVALNVSPPPYSFPSNNIDYGQRPLSQPTKLLEPHNSCQPKFSPVKQIDSNRPTVSLKPKPQQIPFGRTKIHANKMNELMATYKK